MGQANGVVPLILLMAGAWVGGRLAARVGAPPLVGMLLAGLLLRNLPGELLAALPDSWSIGLRLFALTIILLRAGLGLDLEALRRLKAAFLRLAMLPNLTEAATVALAAVVLLNMPAIWAMLLGFVVAAVSPAVVVPSLLDLQERGFGVAKGIPTMILAAASFDDVLSITGFGLSLSLIFGSQAGGESTAASLLQAPLELLFGLGVGSAAGYLVTLVPHRLVVARSIVLAGLGLVAVGVGWLLEFAGGGSLAAMTMGAVAAQSWKHASMPVAIALSRVWSVAQVALFGLIGAAVSFAVVEAGYVVRGMVILAVGLSCRFVVTYLSVGGGLFTSRERLFVALAWIPKATVQAAVGALALDLARQQSAGTEAIEFGTQVVTIAVLAIIVTAPIGAYAIARTGPRWLEQQTLSR